MLIEPHISFVTSNFYFNFIFYTTRFSRFPRDDPVVVINLFKTAVNNPRSKRSCSKLCRAVSLHQTLSLLSLAHFDAVVFVVDCHDVDVFFKLCGLRAFSFFARPAVLKPNFNLAFR